MWWIHYNDLPEVPASLWKVPVSLSGYCCDLWCSTVPYTLGRHQHVVRGMALLGSWEMLFLAEKEGGETGEISKNADFELQLQSSCICIGSPISSMQTWTWPLGFLAWPWRLWISWAVCDAEQCLWTQSWLSLLCALPSPVPGGVAGYHCTLWPLEHHSPSRGTWNPHKSSWNVAAEHKANLGKACWDHDVTQQSMPCSMTQGWQTLSAPSKSSHWSNAANPGRWHKQQPVPTPGTKGH